MGWGGHLGAALRGLERSLLGGEGCLLRLSPAEERRRGGGGARSASVRGGGGPQEGWVAVVAVAAAVVAMVAVRRGEGGPRRSRVRAACWCTARSHASLAAEPAAGAGTARLCGAAWTGRVSSWPREGKAPEAVPAGGSEADMRVSAERAPPGPPHACAGGLGRGAPPCGGVARCCGAGTAAGCSQPAVSRSVGRPAAGSAAAAARSGTDAGEACGGEGASTREAPAGSAAAAAASAGAARGW